MPFENGFDTALWTWMEWAIIGAALLLLIIILFALFKPAKKEKPASAAETTAAKTEKPAPQKTVVEEKPAEPVKQAAAAEEKPEPAEKPATPAPAKRKKPAKYHISQNKDDDSEHAGSWRVRKEGSEKTIKYFTTQKAAIEFAEQLAENQDSSIVIHKKDGSIRKQDYTKK